MVIVYDEDSVRRYMREAVTFSQDRPVLVDRFLEDALKSMSTRLRDGEDVLIAGIMEHIEEAGVHSGDSSCVLPPVSIPEAEIRTIEDYTVKLARALQRDRPDERAVRDQGRRGLCARSESARLAHRALCKQGDGRPAAETRRAADARQEAARRHDAPRTLAGVRWCSSNRRSSRSTNSPAWTRRLDPRCAPPAK